MQQTSQVEGTELQQMFFQKVKASLPPHLSLVDEVAQLLNISNDSAYRRIRGEKSLSLDELQKISSYFHLSIDNIFQLKSDYATFSGKYIAEENFDFGEYLGQMVKDLQYISSFKQKEIIFVSKDIPMFHYLAYPELASFKYFFWMKTILQFSKFANVPFQFEVLIEEAAKTGINVIKLYNGIPSTEIMSIENINTTLRQIEYYKETYQFKNKEELNLLYDKLHEMADHISCEAEKGVKFLPGQNGNHLTGSYKLYVNDYIIGDNSNVVTLDNNKVSFIIHAHVNYLMINDPKFTSYHYAFVQNVIKKSILISEVGEKYRSRFFYLIHDRIEQCRNNQLQTIGKL
jgi:transcriptional regulator with XRE-family HTH domain